MKLVFMGTSQFSLLALQAIAHMANIDIVGVYTKEPKPVGRKHVITKSPVHIWAEKHNLPIFTPKSLRKPETIEDEFRRLNADIAVVASYGLIIPQNILDVPPNGFINIHASILPRWRGASPIQAAIMAGDTSTGITIMKMDAGIDTGDIISQRIVPIGLKTTGEELTQTLGILGAEMIVETLNDLPRYLSQAKKQPEDGATYTGKISTEDCRINFDQPAIKILHKIMALSPVPSAWCEMFGIRMKILDAEVVESPNDKNLVVKCTEGYLRLNKIQPAGKRVMSDVEFLCGHRIP